MVQDGITRYYFVEQKEYLYNDYKEIIDEVFFQRNLCLRRGIHVIFKVTGFLVNKNNVIIIFPKGYRIPTDDKDLYIHIRTLAETLLRYKIEHTLEEEENELLGNEGSTQPEGLSAALWLIKDFQQNGFIRKEVQYHKLGNTGKVDWPRTIKKKTPIISNQTPVYLDYFIKKKNVDYTNKLFQLHVYAVQKSFSKFGWILTSDAFEDDGRFNELPCDINQVAHILQRELEDTFIERDIRLITCLKEFILGSDNLDAVDKLNTLSTSYFHYVWEAICSYIYQNEAALKQHVPKPVWHSNRANSNISQRPDILFQEGESIYILDAKYYDTHNNLPGWHDIVKQFFYYYSVKEKVQKNTKNIFIFPGADEVDLEELGHVDIEGMPSLGEVRAYCINTFEAMKSYSSYKQGSYKEKLIGFNK